LPLVSFVTGSQLSVAVPLSGADSGGDAVAAGADGGGDAVAAGADDSGDPVVVGAPPQAGKIIIAMIRSNTAVARRNMIWSWALTVKLISSQTWNSRISMRCSGTGKKVADGVAVGRGDLRSERISAVGARGNQLMRQLVLK